MILWIALFFLIIALVMFFHKLAMKSSMGKETRSKSGRPGTYKPDGLDGRQQRRSIAKVVHSSNQSR